MSEPRFIGVDPGSHGGIALLEAQRVEAYKIPEDDGELVALLTRLISSHFDVRIFVESVPKFCGAAQWAGRNIQGASMAVLHGSMQLVHGICLGLGHQPVKIVPLKWQNAVGCRNRERLEQGAWKNRLKDHAQSIFPQMKVTLWNADALLIAHAGRILNAR